MIVRICLIVATCVGLISLTGCGITGGTSARKMPLNPTLATASLSHSVAVADVSMRAEGAVNHAIGVINMGKFNEDDIATLRSTLERSLPPSVTPSHAVHVMVQHFGLTFTNNRVACLAIIDWCSTQNHTVVTSERFYAAYDSSEMFLGVETLGMAKNRILRATAVRIAERALAAANNLQKPPAPPLTFDDPAAANATLPQNMTAAAAPGLVAVAVQQTMLGGLDGATRLLLGTLPPPTDWAQQLQALPKP